VSELTSTFNATPDGVMTNEVGVVSGELELRTRREEGGALRLDLRYAGAAEWYTLKGGGYLLHDDRDHATVHDLLVNVLSRPPT
jgi:hypothetical protein